MSRLIVAIGFGFVAPGFLLMISSARYYGFWKILDTALPIGKLSILPILNFVVSFVLLGLLFGAIYKILPDRSLQWKDVVIGAVVTSILFNIGKSLIRWSIRNNTIAFQLAAQPVCLYGFITGCNCLLARHANALKPAWQQASRWSSGKPGVGLTNIRLRYSRTSPRGSRCPLSGKSGHRPETLVHFSASVGIPGAGSVAQ